MTSEYCDYNQLAQVYDDTRVPVGLNLIAQLLKPNHTVLDAGCGTGNYINNLAPLVDKIVGIDGNPEMLNRARSKLENHGNVELKECSFKKRLPFENNTFDFIMVNQVLHHLDTEYDNYPNLQRFLMELTRILKPNGILSINTCLPEQMNGFWYMDLLPRVKKEFAKKYISVQKLGQLLRKFGYNNQFRAVAFPEPIQGLKYFNVLGPMDDTWRIGDSKWSLATPEELKEAQGKVVNLLKEGKLGQYFDEKDKFRREKGQTMFIVGQKLGNQENNKVGERANSNNVKVI